MLLSFGAEGILTCNGGESLDFSILGSFIFAGNLTGSVSSLYVSFVGSSQIRVQRHACHCLLVGAKGRAEWVSHKAHLTVTVNTKKTNINDDDDDDDAAAAIYTAAVRVRVWDRVGVGG